MATQEQQLQHERRHGALAPLFVILLAVVVLVAVLGSLNLVYAQERKAILLMSLIFIGIFGMFVVRDTKPYLFFSLVFATSLYIDFFFNLKDTVNYHSTKGYYLHIIFFPLLVLWLIHLFGVFNGTKKFTFKHTGLLPLAAYVFLSVITIGNSPQPEFTQYEIFSLAACVLLYLLLTNSLERKVEVFAICLGIGGIVLFQGLLSVVQYIKGSPVGLFFLGEAEKLTVDTSLVVDVRRASGTLGYPNNLSLYLDLLLPVVAGMALMTRHFFYRVFFGVATIAGFAAAVLTVSRAGLVGAALGISLVTLYWGYRNKVLIQIAIIMALCFAIVFAGIITTDNPIRARLFQENDNSAQSRIPMMEVAQAIISNNLFWGVGLNNYTDVAYRYDSTSIRITSVFPYPVHNTPLLVLAEIGLFGFLAFSVFIVSRLTKGFWLSFNSNKDYAMLGFSLMVGISIFILHGLVDYTYLSSNFTFWFCCGLLTGLYRLRLQDSRV